MERRTIAPRYSIVSSAEDRPGTAKFGILQDMKQSHPEPWHPMILTVQLPDELGRRLQARASHDGQEPEEYVLRLIERDAASPVPSVAESDLTDEEFDRLLDDLSSGPPLATLPADFSRADLYDDHD
jgi:hypothetical protein